MSEKNESKRVSQPITTQIIEQLEMDEAHAHTKMKIVLIFWQKMKQQRIIRMKAVILSLSKCAIVHRC